MPNFFKPGKITTLGDGCAGSAGKSKLVAYIWKHHRAQFASFAVNTFMENACHIVTHKDGREYKHQCLSGITSVGDYNKQYISPGCVFAKETILKEIKEHNLGPDKLMIHPNAVIVTQKDVDCEKGLVDFEGNPKAERSSSNLKIGSTLHGVGVARARRILRRSDVVLAKDIPELVPYIGETHYEIINMLSQGRAGFGELAQGYQLSLMSEFYPKVTSRNVSVSAFLDDSLLPPSVAGPTILNFRTYPIRVNSNKYVRKSDGKILTWDEWLNTPESDKEMIKGDSGAGYQDQTEVTWDEVSKQAGEKIFETTSLTKLPRRVYTFSKKNLIDSMIYNNTGDDMYISVNFMNYVDSAVKGKTTLDEVLTDKVRTWLADNVFTSDFWAVCKLFRINFKGLFIGTERTIDDVVFVSRDEINELV